MCDFYHISKLNIAAVFAYGPTADTERLASEHQTTQRQKEATYSGLDLSAEQEATETTSKYLQNATKIS